MQLKKVTLHNFRCFERLVVDLHPRLTVIVGDNGAGKTAVLDGIARVLSPVLTNLSSANQRLHGSGIEDGDFRIVKLPNWGGKERWGRSEFTGLEIETEQGLSWDLWESSVPGKKKEGVRGRTELKPYLQRIIESYNTNEPETPPVFAYYGASRGSIEVPLRIRRTKIDYTYPAASLVGALDAYADFREMLAWFGKEEKSELMRNKGLTEVESQALPTLEAVRRAVLAMLHEEYQNPHFIDPGHKFVVERKADGAPLFVDQLSQGYRSMLALAMDFARRLAIANQYRTTLNDGPSIMLVDEIDIHLHPTWQQRVLDDLLRAFPRTQFIVTTHSPQVLTSVDKSSIRVLRQGTTDDGTDTELRLDHVEFQTRGVASGDLLARIMGTSPVPHVPEAEWVDQYHALIQEGLHQQPEGLELRQKLVSHFGLNHPVMREVERMIRLQEFKERLPRGLGHK